MADDPVPDYVPAWMTQAPQPGCTCQSRPLPGDPALGVAAGTHEPGCVALADGEPVTLIVGSSQPILLGSFTLPEGDDRAVGLALFLREWAAAMLQHLAEAGRHNLPGSAAAGDPSPPPGGPDPEGKKGRGGPATGLLT